MIEKVALWIANYPFTKPDICGCDFDGNWLGDGICIGCRHLTSYFDGKECQHQTTRPMTANEVKQTILEYLRTIHVGTD